MEELKAQLARKSEAEAVLKAKFAAHDERQRETLAGLQPVVSEWVKSSIEEAGDYKHELKPLQAFADNLAKAENVESALPFARAIACNSAKFKREREEFSVTSATAEELATANKRVDELVADRDAKTSRISELEQLAEERLQAAEKMQSELAKSGLIHEKNDFSLASSRETAPPTPGATSSAAKAVPAAATAPAVDPLFAFISKSGGGSSRITPSSSSHHLLGASGEPSLESALRFA